MIAEVETKTIKLDFAGLGWIGLNRLESVSKLSGAIINNMVDPSSENLNSAIEKFPEASIADDYNSILNSVSDAVVIATPNALHAEQAIAALEKGKAVFCQKPLGRNAEETKAVIQKAFEKNKLIEVDFSYRYTCFSKIYELIKENKLGKIFAVDLVFHNAYGPGKKWFFDPHLSGGGCLIDLGVHLIDLALWTLNQPAIADLHACLYHRGIQLKNKDTQVEDFATGYIQTSDNITINLSG